MSSKKTSSKLIVNFDISYSLFGISSSEQIFVASIELNKLIKINLSLCKSLELKRNSNLLSFSTFSFNNHDCNLNYSLISNKTKDGFLLENYKNLDYLFIVSSNEQNMLFKQDLFKKLRSEIFIVVSELKLTNKKEIELINNVLYQLWTDTKYTHS